jgi:hypothetical protein
VKGWKRGGKKLKGEKNSAGRDDSREKEKGSKRQKKRDEKQRG